MYAVHVFKTTTRIFNGISNAMTTEICSMQLADHAIASEGAQRGNNSSSITSSAWTMLRTNPATTTYHCSLSRFAWWAERLSWIGAVGCG